MPHPLSDLEIQLLQQRSNTQRLAIALNLTRWARAASLRGMRKANQTNFKEKFAQAVLGSQLTGELTLTSEPSDWTQDPSETMRSLHLILEQLTIPYYITGGIAASMYGDPRSIRNIDLVIDAQPQNISRLTQALEQSGFCCLPTLNHQFTAIDTERLWNVQLSIDSDRSTMTRRQLEAIDEAGNQVWMISPGDLILQKLKLSNNNQQETHWLNALGILKIQINTLNLSFLSTEAERLTISDHLQQALIETQQNYAH